MKENFVVHTPDFDFLAHEQKLFGLLVRDSIANIKENNEYKADSVSFLKDEDGSLGLWLDRLPDSIVVAVKKRIDAFLREIPEINEVDYEDR